MVVFDEGLVRSCSVHLVDGAKNLSQFSSFIKALIHSCFFFFFSSQMSHLLIPSSLRV